MPHIKVSVFDPSLNYYLSSFENISNAFMAEMARKVLVGQNIPKRIETF